MASLEDTAVQLPIPSGHNYAGVAGHDSARLHLGDNYVINQSRALSLFSLHGLPNLTPLQTQTRMLPATSTSPAVTAALHSVLSSIMSHDLSCSCR